ncbi:terminase small subunit [Virgibacillus halophilus]|uniref:Terminase small subunit n=1 Tax=Tigheibacillus halophilus TaxID=361280 RepID=A0ABU5C616_9BACI|nr:terminase small subunit [Virgibacillus halophilus]
MDKFSAKQQIFVDEYIIDMNATQAAIRAGYSKKTARQQGQRLLTKAVIQQAIEKRLDEKKEELIMKQDEILILLSEQARRQATDYQVVLTEKPRFDDDGNFLGIEKKPEIVEVPTQNKDAIKALDLLGKRYAMWTEKQQVENITPVFVDDIPDDDD